MLKRDILDLTHRIGLAKDCGIADDDGEELKFSFESEVPEGLAIDEGSGEITWTPASTLTPGEYAVTVKVTDSGELSATDSLSLKVEDDHASLTKFTGSVALDGVPSAYFRNLGTNARPVLKVGDRVVVSEINAELKEIANRHVLLADAAGVWKLTLGESLRERELIEPAEANDDEPVDNSDEGSSSINESATELRSDDGGEPKEAAEQEADATDPPAGQAESEDETSPQSPLS